MKFLRNFLHNRYFISFLSILCIFAVWIICSVIVSSSLILPPPLQVLKAIIELCGSSSFWHDFAFTFLRVILAFCVSMICGFILGVAAGYFKSAEYFLEVPLSIIKASPVISFILIAFFWFKSGTVPVVIAVVMTLPAIVGDVKAGIQNTDLSLLKMAKVYRLSAFQVFWNIRMNAVKPFLQSAAKTAFGLCWKVVAAGEVLCLPKYSAGTILHTSQMHLETARVIAVTVLLVVSSLLVEKLFVLVYRFLSGQNQKLHLY